MQNAGHLSRAKRDRFAELTDAEIAAMAAVIGDTIHAGLQDDSDTADLFDRAPPPD